jgi:AAA+ superfamily predicted ATPase
MQTKQDLGSPIAYADNLAQLQAGLSYADALLRWAIQAAHAACLDPQDEFRGLYVSAEQVTQLLAQDFGSRLWQPSATDSEAADKAAAQRAALTRQRQQWQMRSAASREAGVKMHFDALTNRFELSAAEVDALLIALLPELDSRYERIFAYLQDDVTQKRPSINLILNLLTAAYPERMALRRRFLADGRLLQSRLIQRCAYANAPEATLLSHYIRPFATVVAYLLGHASLDQQLSGCTLTRPPASLPTPARIDGRLLTQLNQVVAAANRPPLLSFIGPYGVGKEEAARHLAAATQRPLLHVNLTALRHSDLGLAEGIALIMRDGRLHAAHLYLTGWEQSLLDDHRLHDLWMPLLTYPHLVVVAGDASWQPRQHLHARPIFFVDFPLPDFQTRLQAWQQHLGQNGRAAALNLPHLANSFQFTPGQIEDVVATAHNLAGWRQATMTAADLLAAGRHHSNQRLSTLANKIQPHYDWHDIVLPADTLAQLKEMAATVRQRYLVYEQWGFGQKLARGQGLAALFVGESGTGKTMSADIIAGELGLDLYKIDLSTLVSKYIGETEKNLERVFTEAATSNAILFFDEADAIFGKRSEVRDSHDRYANLEVSYLLQRLEQYEGIVILASNLQTNIDDAFTRRLQFIIEFPFPRAAERELIWRANCPEALPRDDAVDFSLLAERFPIAGGNIRNVILAAAFLAAEAGQVVAMPHFLHAARREYQKIGRLIDEKLFVAEVVRPETGHSQYAGVA